jgi:SAM-dependent methyltransferase
LHGERDRAEWFGFAAEEYDRYRPGYPAALIDDLLSRHPTRGLDVGCGTGKVARALMERGLSVLGVEPDVRMAEVAQRHDVPVEVSSFEAWEPGERRFDLLTAGHSWHWIDPVIGLAKAASVVVPGGTVALFWNYHVVDQPLLAAFKDVYRGIAPGVTIVGRDPSASDTPDVDPFNGSSDFASLGSRTYRWPRILDGNEWTSMLATLSDHARLGQPRLSRLQEALKGCIQQAGGQVHSRCGTYVWSAQRVPSAIDR